MSSWQDIATAPRDGTMIIAFWPGGGAWNVPAPGVLPTGCMIYPNHVEYFPIGWDGGIPGEQPTHWQPLPPPPTRGETT